jgi:hypothetical protein
MDDGSRNENGGANYDEDKEHRLLKGVQIREVYRIKTSFCHGRDTEKK